jgi:hypothetical protein
MCAMQFAAGQRMAIADGKIPALRCINRTAIYFLLRQFRSAGLISEVDCQKICAEGQTMSLSGPDMSTANG